MSPRFAVILAVSFRTTCDKRKQLRVRQIATGRVRLGAETSKGHAGFIQACPPNMR